ncbi:MAG: YkgJ family cysteine cluster protein [Candidatus Altiarchaeota archaeon]|nr:YkgJ family cysteine cluster protein [Candidatus Altiarchaeota archaeon]
MDAPSVVLAFAIITLLFSAGVLSVFIQGARLARKKNTFSCEQCGNCCRLRTIQLSKDDITRMEKGGLQNFYETAGGEARIKRIKGRCVFLDAGGSCSVYDIRPEVCRRFPFFTLFGIPYCRHASFCPGVENLQKCLKKAQ